MSPTLQQARELSVQELAVLHPVHLARLQSEAKHAVSEAKAVKDWVDHVISSKYAERATQLRHQIGKDTGTVRFDDQDFTVIADLPKKPVWDQSKLAVIAKRIAKSGDDPSEFMEISYTVSEHKFTAWPEQLRSVFAPARTLKTGKPSFRIASKNTEVAV